MPEPEQHPFTVIGVWEETGEVLAEHVFAADPHEAMKLVSGCRDDPASLTILGAVDGKISLIAACEDSGKAACALDLCGESL